jgi:hypothetical protein
MSELIYLCRLRRCGQAEWLEGEPMKSLIGKFLAVAGLVLGLTMVSAQTKVSAQTPMMNDGGNIGDHAAKATQQADKEDKTKVKANDKAYNAALRNLPDKQYDPWHGVR